MRIRRGLSSRVLPCGCLAGIYETYRNEIVMIVDARSATCGDPAHVNGNILPEHPRDLQSDTPRGPLAK